MLGSCLLENDQIDEAAAWLEEGDFFRAANGEVWAAILALRDSGQPADAVTLAEHLKSRGRFEAIGGDETLREICDAVPHGANATYYARIVRELSVARQILQASLDTAEEIFARQFAAPELIERVEERIFRITDRSVNGTTVSCKDMIQESFDHILRLRDKKTSGLRSGLRDLDGLTGGFNPGQLIILAARPGVGKTAMGLNVASSVAAEGHGVLFASLEMTRRELGKRLISAYGQIPGGSLAKPWFLSDSEMDHVGRTCDAVSPFPLWVDDTPVRTVTQIQANARRIKHRSPNGLALIVIDYLSLINGQKAKGESRQEEVAGISRRLKRMAKDLRVPVLCLHQLKREVDHRDSEIPKMADLRESGQIEQDADLIVLIHRPDRSNRDLECDVAKLIVAKNRDGAEGDISLTFVRNQTRFDSFQPAIPDVPPPNGQPF